MGEHEERESEAQTLMATPIRGYAEGSAASTVTPMQGFYGDLSRTAYTIPALWTMEGNLEDGTTTSELIQTTPPFQDWKSVINMRRRALQRNRPRDLGSNSISFPLQVEGTSEDGTTTSESIQTTPASRTWNSSTLPRGTVLRRDRLTGRTRMMVTGEFIPENEDPQVSAINVGILRATTSDEEKYCMLDSGANVMVVPLKKGMIGDKTMCSLVGDNKTQGLIISRLYTEARTYLVVAVENASVLLPPAYLVRIAGYKLAWEYVPGGEYFQLQDGYGETVAVQEDDDLLFLGKNILWRVGHDMYRFAHRQTSMTWSEIWEQLTGESSVIRAISTTQTNQSVEIL